jgi:hypothetical protein
VTDKKLMNEVLPTPTKTEDSGARDRVLAHMRKLVKVGAASAALAACPPSSGPFGVVDPMPAPARCRNAGEVLDQLSGSVKRGDAGNTVMLVIDAATIGYRGVELNMAGGVAGGSIRSLVRSDDSKKMTMAITTTARIVTLILTVSCGSDLQPVKVTVDPSSLTVKFSDPAADAG